MKPTGSPKNRLRYPVFPCHTKSIKILQSMLPIIRSCLPFCWIWFATLPNWVYCPIVSQNLPYNFRNLDPIAYHTEHLWKSHPTSLCQPVLCARSPWNQSCCRSTLVQTPSNLFYGVQMCPSNIK
jgi:hypothetical protein